MSLLRSSNYFRLYLTNLNRALISTASPKICLRNISTSQVVPSVSSFNRNTFPSSNLENSNFETTLNKLDATVKRTSRVNKVDVDHAIYLIKNSHSVTPSQALLVLRCCGSMLPEERPEVRTKMVQKLCETFESLGIKFDISHYNTLLKVYFENGYKFSPSEFLLNIEKNGIQPNRVTYQRLIAHYCLMGDIEGATKILQFMKEKQLPINEQVFNSLILGHSECNDLESAEGIIKMMQEAGVKPSNETYTTLSSGFAKSGNIEKINQLITQCETSDVVLLDRDYLEIAFALAINGYGNLVPQILSKVRRVMDYNQDAINTILRMISAGQVDAAFEVYKTMNKTIKNDEGSGLSENSSDGNFFIRQLVRCNCPLEKIKQYTEILGHENSNPYIYLVAVKCALRDGNIELSKQLMKFAEEKGFPTRPHYFWPLIKSCGNTKDVEGIYSVLAMMIQDFNIFQHRETLREVVAPELLKNGESWQSVIDRTTSLGVPVGTTTSAVVVSLLKRDEIQDAATIVSQYRAYYQPYFVRPILIKAFFKTRDLNSLITILRAMYLSVQRQVELTDTSEDLDDPHMVPDKKAMISKTVYEVLSNLTKNKSDIDTIEEFLKGLLDNGLGISEDCAVKIQSWLKPSLTPELANIIEKLASEDLEPVPLLTPQRSGSFAHDEKALEQLAESLIRRGKPTDSVKIQLFQMYCRNKQLEKALAVKKELEDAGVTFSKGISALLIDLHISLEDIDKALEILENLQKDDPNFNLDYSKTIKLATLLVQKDRIEDAIQLLESWPCLDKKTEESLFLQVSLCHKLLNAVAEKGDVDQVEKFLNFLISKHFVEVSNVLLGPIIKTYLNKGDLKGALDKFEHFCHTYNFTPMKNELMMRCIESEDAVALQRLTDLSTEIHGEVNSLYDLMAAFLDMGRIRQARKILETPGLRIRQDRLSLMSKKCVMDKNEEQIKRLLEVTKGVHSIDRSVFFEDSLDLYAKENNVEKAYGLWTEMQEKDESPSDLFLIKLSKILRNNNREVPFQVPDAPKQDTKRPESGRIDDRNPLQRFRSYVNNREFSKAMSLKDHRSITPSEKSRLIELLLQEGQLNEASKLVLGVLETGYVPKMSLLRFFLKKLSESGNVEAMEAVGKHFNTNLKRELFYTPKLYTAYEEAGKKIELFEKLNSTIENVRHDDELRSLFPLRTILRIILKDAALLPQLETVAKTLRKQNFIDGDIILWNAYFALNTKPEEANELQKSLSESENMYFIPLLKISENKADLSMVERLKEVVWQEKNTPRLDEKKGVLISGELRVLLRENKIEEAMNRLESGLKCVDISCIRQTPLRLLKQKAEERNIPFTYIIPEKTLVHDDDEDVQKFSSQ